MPVPGSVWATDTWDADAWAADTWADAVSSNVLDTSLERISAMHFMLPFRHIGVAEDKTGWHAGKRQGAITMYAGVMSLTYGWGVEAPYQRNAVEVQED